MNRESYKNREYFLLRKRRKKKKTLLNFQDNQRKLEYIKYLLAIEHLCAAIRRCDD